MYGLPRSNRMIMGKYCRTQRHRASRKRGLALRKMFKMRQSVSKLQGI